MGRNTFQAVFLVAILSTIGFSCNFANRLQIVETILCDLWNKKGVCLEPWNQNSREYKIPKKVFQNLESNQELIQYLYFHARETPGILVRWNREPTKEEWNLETNESCRFRYTFRNTTDSFPGFDKGKTFMGAFQYLGSILEPALKQEGTWNEKPNLDEFRNLPMKFHRTCMNSHFEREVFITVATE